MTLTKLNQLILLAHGAGAPGGGKAIAMDRAPKVTPPELIEALRELPRDDLLDLLLFTHRLSGPDKQKLRDTMQEKFPSQDKRVAALLKAGPASETLEAYRRVM